LLESYTGIVHYRNAFRSAVLKFITHHADEVALAFNKVNSHSADADGKVREVSDLIQSLERRSVGGYHLSPFSPLTPVLSCLDPQCRFPIMNERAQNLLRCIQQQADAEGMVALTKLISSKYGIRDAFELDAYVVGQKFPKPERRARTFDSNKAFKDVGLKSEIDSTAEITAKKTTITKLHNTLINRLNKYVLWRYGSPKESRFDALLLGWKKNRDLLIEAKTASDGPTGRAQVRQAIGQLYDYRFTYMPKDNVDLAVLVPKEPNEHVKQLLGYLGIELLWFKGKALKGTIEL
jgi:hypothetical protein